MGFKENYYSHFIYQKKHYYFQKTSINIIKRTTDVLIDKYERNKQYYNT